MPENSLIALGNSLFKRVGNLTREACKNCAFGRSKIENQARIESIPVLFPDTRETATRDGFDYDCVRHQQFQYVVVIVIGADVA